MLPAAADHGCERCYRRLRMAATDGAGGCGPWMRTMLLAPADGGYGRCYQRLRTRGHGRCYRRLRTADTDGATSGGHGRCHWSGTHDNQGRTSKLQLKSKNFSHGGRQRAGRRRVMHPQVHYKCTWKSLSRECVAHPQVHRCTTWLNAT